MSYITEALDKLKLLESKEDIQRFVDKFGEDNYKKFTELKDRIKKFDTIDLTYHTKNSSVQDIEKIIQRAEDREYTQGQKTSMDIEGKPIPQPKNTKKLIYNEDGDKIYYITDVSDMIDISSEKYGGVIGNWCIAGRYDTGGKVKVSQAEYYFGAYLDKTDGGYYVFLPRDGKNKYCILGGDNNQPQSEIKIYDYEDDYRVPKEFFEIFPKIGDFFEKLGYWEPPTEKPFYWDGKGEVPSNTINLIIKDGVEHLSRKALRNCRYLRNIFIPKDMTKYETDALEEITFRVSENGYPSDDFFWYLGTDADDVDVVFV